MGHRETDLVEASRRPESDIVVCGRLNKKERLPIYVPSLRGWLGKDKGGDRAQMHEEMAYLRIGEIRKHGGLIEKYQ